MMKAELSGTETDEADHTTSTPDVSMKMDTSSTDVGTSLLQELSFTKQSLSDSAVGHSSLQQSPQKDGTLSATSTSASATATTTTTTAEDDQTEASVESTELPVSANDFLTDNAVLASPTASTALAMSPEKPKIKSAAAVSADKNNISEDRSVTEATSAPVVSKT